MGVTQLEAISYLGQQPGRRDFTANCVSPMPYERRVSSGCGGRVRTLRQRTVAGGEVVKASRLAEGKNIRWEITVQPSGNANATIVLPVTTDCASREAICAGDGRMLSQRVELAVSGPSG